MIMAVPVTALIYALVSEFVNYRLLAKNLYVDENDFHKLPELDDQ